jgi:CheY-like chemotaxis protein
MGASVGVFSVRGKVLDDEAVHHLADILKYDHSRRAFVRFMHSKDLDCLVNFSYELESLLAPTASGETELDSYIEKAETLCDNYIGPITLKAPQFKFSYPFVNKPLTEIGDVTIALNLLLLEARTYMATYIVEYSESTYIEDSLLGDLIMDSQPFRQDTISPRTPRSSFTTAKGTQTSPITPQSAGNSGKSPKGSLVAAPRFMGMMSGKQLRSGSDPDDVTPISLTAVSSLSAPGSPHSSKKMAAASLISTFPDKFPKVLVIDDCESSTKIMKRMFQTAGHFDVHTATNGSSGLEIFKSVMPSIVVVDVYMPIMGGVDTIRRLRDHQDEVSDNGGSVVTEVEATNVQSSDMIMSGRRSRGPSFENQQTVIIIAISAQGGPELVEEVSRAGADGFLLKPITVDGLANIITRAINTGPARC